MLMFLYTTTLLTVVFAEIPHLNRHLKSELKCQSSNNKTILYTRADGPNDTLHYLISSYGVPSVLVARTDLVSNITINCEKLLNVSTAENSINFTSKPEYVFVVSFNKILEYNDTNDDADISKLDNTTAWKVIDLGSNLKWNNVSAVSNISNHLFNLQTVANSSNLQLKENGSLTFRFKQYGEGGEMTALPHLQYTTNTTQMELILDNMETSFMNSRFVIEMSLVSSKVKGEKASQIFVHRSIDDEHTPGVFEVFNWNVGGDNQTTGAYLQWKPVCYIWEPRSITNSTQLKSYSLKNSTLKPKVLSLAYAYFGEDTTDYVMMSTNVSFGLSKDKFYKLTNYTAWTMSIGYGSPPTEKISLLIILIISIGLGIPVILIMLGGLFTCIKRKDQQMINFSSGYTQIQ